MILQEIITNNSNIDIVTTRLVPFQGGFDKRIPDKKAESIYQNRIEEVLEPGGFQF
jgi:hypothetical protein